MNWMKKVTLVVAPSADQGVLGTCHQLPRCELAYGPPHDAAFRAADHELRRMKNMKTQRTTLFTAAALLACSLITASAGAAVIVPGANINGASIYSVTGTLYAIDGPKIGGTPDASNDFFTQISGASGESVGNQAAGLRNAWEPDGTAYAETTIRWTGGPVSWRFDLADGTVINGVFANWAAQGNAGSSNTYSWDEGTPESAVRSHTSATPLDLRLDWAGFTSTGVPTTYFSNFDQLNTGPITVADGNGFTVTLTPQSGAFPFVDAIVLDVAPVPEPASLALVGLGGFLGGLMMIKRRRR